MKKRKHGNSGRFDMVEGLNAEKEGQTDLREVDMWPDSERGFLRQSLVCMRLYADSPTLSKAPDMAPFSSYASVLPRGTCHLRGYLAGKA